jgi:hypothetical protein
MKPERLLQLHVSQFLQTQYPRVLFNLDTSGNFTTIGQAKLNKRMRSGNKWPDLFIAEARGGYFGLYIELKAVTPFKKDGTLKANEHVKAQNKMLDRLNDRGYMACFGVGLDATINIIKMYLSQPKPITL